MNFRLFTPVSIMGADFDNHHACVSFHQNPHSHVMVNYLETTAAGRILHELFVYILYDNTEGHRLGDRQNRNKAREGKTKQKPGGPTQNSLSLHCLLFPFIFLSSALSVLQPAAGIPPAWIQGLL